MADFIVPFMKKLASKMLLMFLGSLTVTVPGPISQVSRGPWGLIPPLPPPKKAGSWTIFCQNRTDILAHDRPT